MARVNFSALIESIVGKLAGSVFQGSYGGYQIRTRVSPNNPRTNYQQLRRGEFAFITQSWRFLTSPQRSDWISNAPGGMSGFHFYVQTNVNLTLINQDIIQDYVPGAVPDAFPLAIDTLGDNVFTVKASGIATSVPAGCTLLLFSTAEKLPGKIFTSPSEYTPIGQFDQYTDLSAATSVASWWVQRFGQFTTDKRICINSVIIANANGARSNDSFTCADETPEMQNFIPLFTWKGEDDYSGTTPPKVGIFTLPANTLKVPGDQIIATYKYFEDDGGTTWGAMLWFGSQHVDFISVPGGYFPLITLKLTLKDSTHVWWEWEIIQDQSPTKVQLPNSTTFDPSIANDLAIQGIPMTSQVWTLFSAEVTFIAAPL